MTWTPADISATCQQYPSLLTCEPSVLALMVFMAHNFGHSYDDQFTSPKPNKTDGYEPRYYDFIIVGAGSAGCVVANRLTEIEDWKVLLLEAGGEEPAIAEVPGVYRTLSGSSVDWNYRSEAEPVVCGNSEGRACSLPRGKVMGGSSSINGMAYVRGTANDYDEWARLGNDGWSARDVLPYFLKSEDNQDQDVLKANPELHSRGGYLSVGRFPYRDRNSDVLVEAWNELGVPQVDLNGPSQLGVGRYQTANINGARQSTNGAFIRPIRSKRPNLFVKTNAQTTRILIDPRTKRAIGVEYSASADKKLLKRVYARKEVIVSAGTFDSPKLLMLSGIGHAEELEKAGIKVIVDLPVGDNLQDHVMMPSSIIVFDNDTSTLLPASEMRNDIIYWLNTHQGPMASIGGPPSAMTFIQTSDKLSPGIPDIQVYHFNAVIEDIEESRNYNGVDSYIPVVYYSAVALNPTVLRVQSRGTVRLNVTNPTWSQPVIRLNYLTHPKDLKTLVNGALAIKRLFDTEVFKKYGLKKYERPAEACKSLEFESPEYFECDARNHARPGLHLVGTCRMAPKNDSRAVVDPRLRVHGVKGLRVIDASIMPSLPSGTAYAPTIMVGEKGSDLIKEDWLA